MHDNISGDDKELKGNLLVERSHGFKIIVLSRDAYRIVKYKSRTVKPNSKSSKYSAKFKVNDKYKQTSRIKSNETIS